MKLQFDAHQDYQLEAIQAVVSLFAGQPDADLVQLAWVGALLITFGVLALNIVARAVLRPRR